MCYICINLSSSIMCCIFFGDIYLSFAISNEFSTNSFVFDDEAVIEFTYKFMCNFISYEITVLLVVTVSC